MSEKYTKQLDELASELVTPERFGKVALAPILQLPLPELARIFDFPEQTGDSGV